MKDRLRQFLAAENISQAQFADTINVVRASVSHILAGRNNPSFDFIKALMLNYPRLNVEWLMFGKGRMYKDNILFPEFEEEQLPEQYASKESPIETEATNSETQVTVSQRKVSKVIILFDDGSYQEM